MKPYLHIALVLISTLSFAEVRDCRGEKTMKIDKSHVTWEISPEVCEVRLLGSTKSDYTFLFKTGTETKLEGNEDLYSECKSGGDGDSLINPSVSSALGQVHINGKTLIVRKTYGLADFVNHDAGEDFGAVHSYELFDQDENKTLVYTSLPYSSNMFSTNGNGFRLSCSPSLRTDKALNILLPRYESIFESLNGGK